MSDQLSSQVVVVTSIVTFLSGFLLGVYSIRGYLLPPSLVDQRRRNFVDPVESEESDIDEDDSILDHAPNWSNGHEADRRDGLRQRPGVGAGAGAGTGTEAKAAKKHQEQAASELLPAAALADSDEECKLVLVVRTDLGMTKGKIAAQCSHATLACYKTLSKAAQKAPQSPEARLLRHWEKHGQAKIAVQVKSQDELMTLMGTARSLGITAEVIQDAGRTQIESGSLTVLGVGPAPKSMVDKVTGGLKLL